MHTLGFSLFWGNILLSPRKSYVFRLFPEKEGSVTIKPISRTRRRLLRLLRGPTGPVAQEIDGGGGGGGGAAGVGDSRHPEGNTGLCAKVGVDLVIGAIESPPRDR